MTNFGVHFHPKYGHFLVAGDEKYYSFLHLYEDEYKHTKNSIEIRRRLRLKRFSYGHLKYEVHLPPLTLEQSPTNLTCDGSEVACNPYYFISMVNWINARTDGLWNIEIFPQWESPPFCFRFERSDDADRFRSVYGKNRSAIIIEFPRKLA